MADEQNIGAGNAGADQPVSGESATLSASSPELFNNFSQQAQQIIQQLIIAGGGAAFSGIGGIKQIFGNAVDNVKQDRGIDLLILANETARHIEKVQQEIRELTTKIIENTKKILPKVSQIVATYEETQSTAEKILEGVKNDPNVSEADKVAIEESIDAANAAAEDVKDHQKTLVKKADDLADAKERLDTACNCEHPNSEEIKDAAHNFRDKIDEIHATVSDIISLQKEHGQNMRTVITIAKKNYPEGTPERNKINKLENLVNQAQGYREELEALAENGQQMTPEYLAKIEELGALNQSFQNQVTHLPEKDQEALAPILAQFQKPAGIIEQFSANKDTLLAAAQQIAANQMTHYTGLIAENARVTDLRDNLKIDLKDMQTGLVASTKQLQNLDLIDSMQEEIMSAINSSEAKDRAEFINDQFGGAINFHVKLNGTNHFSRHPQDHVTTADGNVAFKKGNEYFAEVKGSDGEMELVEITDELEITKLRHQAWVDGKPFGNETRYGENMGEGLLTSLFGSDDTNDSKISLQAAADQTKSQINAHQSHIQTLESQITEQENGIQEYSKQIETYTQQITDKAEHLATAKEEVDLNGEYGLNALAVIDGDTLETQEPSHDHDDHDHHAPVALPAIKI